MRSKESKELRELVEELRREVERLKTVEAIGKWYPVPQPYPVYPRPWFPPFQPYWSTTGTATVTDNKQIPHTFTVEG